jgi:hypothetical protein
MANWIFKFQVITTQEQQKKVFIFSSSFGSGIICSCVCMFV